MSRSGLGSRLPTGRLSRALHVARAQGPKAAARMVVARVQPYVHVDEEHVWYERPLGDERPVEWPDGLRLVTGSAEHVAVLEGLGSVSPNEARRRLAAATRWRLVFDGDQVLFSCWLFSGRAPVLAAPGGWLALPDDTLVLEDSVTSAAARGRGIAPRAWNALAVEAQASGFSRIMTKVGVDNTASRRAVTKGGYEERAVMSFRRVGPWRRTTVRPVDGSVAPDWLVRELGQR